jgi:predicted nucleic acid-binding protein
MGLIRDIGRGPVALDTVIFIYFIEESPEFLALVEPVFAAIDAGRLQAISSTLTLLETLVIPYRAGNVALAERFETILTGSRGVRLLEIDRLVLRSAAQLRAAFSIKTPDALQLATALAGSATTFLTNDRKLPAIAGLRILQMRDYA